MSPLGWDIVISDGVNKFFLITFSVYLYLSTSLVDLPVLPLMAKNPKLFSAVME